jgi:hypothetical protein
VTCRVVHATKWRVLVRMVGFITNSLLIALTHRQYSAIADLHTLQNTVAHVLGFFVFTSRFLATDLNTETASLILQILHINLIFTEAFFTTHAEN